MKSFIVLTMLMLFTGITIVQGQVKESIILSPAEIDTLAYKLSKSEKYKTFLQESSRAGNEARAHVNNLDYSKYTRKQFNTVLIDSTLTLTQRIDSLKSMGFTLPPIPSNINESRVVTKELYSEFPELPNLSQQARGEVFLKAIKLINGKSLKKQRPRQDVVKRTAPSTSNDYDKVFTKVEQSPQFPGGAESWKKYLERNLKADTPAKDGAPAGTYTVKVQFLTDVQGNVSNVQAIEVPKQCPSCAMEAIKVIVKGPKWQPAVQNGRNVVFQNVQQISFRVAAL